MARAVVHGGDGVLAAAVETDGAVFGAHGLEVSLAVAQGALQRLPVGIGQAPALGEAGEHRHVHDHVGLGADDRAFGAALVRLVQDDRGAHRVQVGVKVADDFRADVVPEPFARKIIRDAWPERTRHCTAADAVLAHFPDALFGGEHPAQLPRQRGPGILGEVVAVAVARDPGAVAGAFHGAFVEIDDARLDGVKDAFQGGEMFARVGATAQAFGEQIVLTLHLAPVAADLAVAETHLRPESVPVVFHELLVGGVDELRAHAGLLVEALCAVALPDSALQNEVLRAHVVGPHAAHGGGDVHRAVACLGADEEGEAGAEIARDVDAEQRLETPDLYAEGVGAFAAAQRPRDGAYLVDAAVVPALALAADQPPLDQMALGTDLVFDAHGAGALGHAKGRLCRAAMEARDGVGHVHGAAHDAGQRVFAAARLQDRGAPFRATFRRHREAPGRCGFATLVLGAVGAHVGIAQALAFGGGGDIQRRAAAALAGAQRLAAACGQQLAPADVGGGLDPDVLARGVLAAAGGHALLHGVERRHAMGDLHFGGDGLGFGHGVRESWCCQTWAAGLLSTDGSRPLFCAAIRRSMHR